MPTNIISYSIDININTSQLAECCCLRPMAIVWSNQTIYYGIPGGLCRTRLVSKVR